MAHQQAVCIVIHKFKFKHRLLMTLSLKRYSKFVLPSELVWPYIYNTKTDCPVTYLRSSVKKLMNAVNS